MIFCFTCLFSLSFSIFCSSRSLLLSLLSFCLLVDDFLVNLMSWCCSWSDDDSNITDSSLRLIGSTGFPSVSLSSLTSWCCSDSNSSSLVSVFIGCACCTSGAGVGVSSCSSFAFSTSSSCALSMLLYSILNEKMFLTVSLSSKAIWVK